VKFDDPSTASQWENTSKAWWSPADWVNFPDQTLFTEAATRSYRYWKMMYYAFLFVYTNEIGPINNNEFFVTYMILLLSIFFVAFIFGDINDIF